MESIRVQRKRTKGWKMPPDTVYVGRGSKWGNPYKVIKKGKIYHLQFLSSITAYMTKSKEYAYKEFIDRYWDYILTETGAGGNLDITELKGKNLACWCPLDQPCHADVLLELANKEEE